MRLIFKNSGAITMQSVYIGMLPSPIRIRDKIIRAHKIANLSEKDLLEIGSQAEFELKQRIDFYSTLTVLAAALTEYQLGLVTEPIGGYGFYLNLIESCGNGSSPVMTLCWIKASVIPGGRLTFDFETIRTFSEFSDDNSTEFCLLNKAVQKAMCDIKFTDIVIEVIDN